jgi:hypothetical protein
MGRLVAGAAVAMLAACGTASSEPKPDVRMATFSADAYADHIKQLRTHLRPKGLGAMAIRIEDPFVVIGDGTEADLARGASTVRWAADKLEQDFFARRPAKILDIYLFSDAHGYEEGVRALTGESPSTPYGFYSSTERALIMNISTGGGTLVHEIVHPYVEADFPRAPSWLNEGLGSLFEQSAERDGHIVGHTNWRLAGLQRAIASDQVPSFEDLTRLTATEFYDDDRGTNYAQSRYLLYYLQENGLLREFYKKFRAARAKDPTGYKTLMASLGETDMGAFKVRWQRYVAALRFP